MKYTMTVNCVVSVELPDDVDKPGDEDLRKIAENTVSNCFLHPNEIPDYLLDEKIEVIVKMPVAGYPRRERKT